MRKVGTDGLEVVAEEIAQPEVLVGAEILAAAEQQPTGFPEDWSAALTFHAAGLLGTDVVQCLVHIGDDVEAVEDMQGLGAVFADELKMASSPFATEWRGANNAEENAVEQQEGV